jgi:hypothetical protein
MRGRRGIKYQDDPKKKRDHIWKKRERRMTETRKGNK